MTLLLHDSLFFLLQKATADRPEIQKKGKAGQDIRADLPVAGKWDDADIMDGQAACPCIIHTVQTWYMYH